MSCLMPGSVLPKLNNPIKLTNQNVPMISLSRKDIHMIFAEPVSDTIAPGYSSIISNPMDLSTMQVTVLSSLIPWISALCR